MVGEGVVECWVLLLLKKRGLPGLLWAFPRGKAAGSVLRRARPDGLGSARPAFRPSIGLVVVPEGLLGVHCGRALLQGSLPFTPHTLSPLTQEKLLYSVNISQASSGVAAPPLPTRGGAPNLPGGGTPMRGPCHSPQAQKKEFPHPFKISGHQMAAFMHHGGGAGKGRCGELGFVKIDVLPNLSTRNASPHPSPLTPHPSPLNSKL
jgi:hypothetical protein